MIEPRKFILLALAFSFAVSVSATSVINSDDWKTVVKAQNHADLRNQDTFTIATPADAKIAMNTLEESGTLYTGTSPTLADLERRTTLNFDSKKRVDSEKVPSDSEGFVVVKDRFGTDAAAVKPYAAYKNYSIVFYTEESAQKLENSTRPKLFYGDFGFDPSQRFSNSRYINGSWQERNIEIARRMDSEWALLTPRNYFDPESLGDMPVLFRMEREKLSDFLDNSDIDKIKVTGPDNMLYAKELDVITDKDLSIAVKTGRAFTGISGFDGIYGIKKIETPYRRYDARLSDVMFDNTTSTLAIDFINKGNTVRNIEGNITASETKKFELTLPEFSSVTYTVNISRNFSEVTVDYSKDSANQERVFTRDEVDFKKISSLGSLKVAGINKSSDTLGISLRNTGNKDFWAMVQAGEDYSRKRLAEGDTKNFRLEAVGQENYTVFKGSFENQYSYSNTYKIQETTDDDIYFILAVALAFLVVLGLTGYVIYEFTR